MTASDRRSADRRADPDILLAFDHGLRRIGVASANLRTRTATPLTTLTSTAEPPWTQLDRLMDEWLPGALVVGMPADTNSAIGRAARAFASSLAERYGLPVARVDESLTSRAAWSQLREARRTGYLRRRAARDRLDRQAACLIAEQWMNELANGRAAD